MSSQDSDVVTPPLEPSEEATEHEHASFSARCQVLIASFLANTNWEFRGDLVTRSAEWGLIWRGDYAVADISPQLVNRIMCWEGTDGQLLIEIAVGQRIAPLAAISRGEADDPHE